MSLCRLRDSRTRIVARDREWVNAAKRKTQQQQQQNRQCKTKAIKWRRKIDNENCFLIKIYKNKTNERRRERTKLLKRRQVKMFGGIFWLCSSKTKKGNCVVSFCSPKKCISIFNGAERAWTHFESGTFSLTHRKSNHLHNRLYLWLAASVFTYSSVVPKKFVRACQNFMHLGEKFIVCVST